MICKNKSLAKGIFATHLPRAQVPGEITEKMSFKSFSQRSLRALWLVVLLMQEVYSEILCYTGLTSLLNTHEHQVLCALGRGSHIDLIRKRDAALIDQLNVQSVVRFDGGIA